MKTHKNSLKKQPLEPILPNVGFEQALLKNEQPQPKQKQSIKMRDKDNDGTVSNSEIKTQKQSSVKIAEDIMTHIQKSNANVVLLGEPHGATPHEQTLYILQLLANNKPHQKIAFGVEINIEQFQNTYKFIRELSPEKLRTLSVDQRVKVTEHLNNLFLTEMALIAIQSSPITKQAYEKGDAKSREKMILSILSANAEDIGKRQHHLTLDLMIFARTLGFDVVFFDTPIQVNEKHNGFSDAQIQQREQKIANALAKPLETKQAQFVVALIGNIHGAKDAKEPAKILNQTLNMKFASEVSARQLLEGKRFSVLSFNMIDSSKEYDNSVTKSMHYKQYDGHYSF